MEEQAPENHVEGLIGELVLVDDQNRKLRNVVDELRRLQSGLRDEHTLYQAETTRQQVVNSLTNLMNLADAMSVFIQAATSVDLPDSSGWSVEPQRSWSRSNLNNLVADVDHLKSIGMDAENRHGELCRLGASLLSATNDWLASWKSDHDSRVSQLTEIASLLASVRPAISEAYGTDGLRIIEKSIEKIESTLEEIELVDVESITAAEFSRAGMVLVKTGTVGQYLDSFARDMDRLVGALESWGKAEWNGRLSDIDEISLPGQEAVIRREAVKRAAIEYVLRSDADAVFSILGPPPSEER